MIDDSPFRRLLFAVDETESSRRAFPLVAAYARAWRAHLHLVHVRLPGDRPASARASGALVGDMVDALAHAGVAGSGQVHTLCGEDAVGAVVARPSRVMVAIDGSASADLALADAVRFARPTDAAVRVLHAREPAAARTAVGLEGDEDARRVVQTGVDAVQVHALELPVLLAHRA